MKKNKIAHIIMMFVTIASFTLTSCEKENSELILGKWEIVEASSKMNSITIDLSKTINYFEFQQGGIGETNVGALDLSTGLVHDFQTIKLDWSVNDDILTMSLLNYEIQFTINELTKTDMILSATSQHEELGDIIIQTNISLRKL